MGHSSSLLAVVIPSLLLLSIIFVFLSSLYEEILLIFGLAKKKSNDQFSIVHGQLLSVVQSKQLYQQFLSKYTLPESKS